MWESLSSPLPQFLPLAVHELLEQNGEARMLVGASTGHYAILDRGLACCAFCIFPKAFCSSDRVSMKFVLEAD